ncbi:MAG: hypothetical protein LBJ84_05875, partial [Oscillospiraceae bacterium]|nr:hypothetical protein [Oscillospiraceae bacterium]
SYIPVFFVDTDTRNFTNLFSDGYFVMKTGCPYLNLYEIPSELVAARKESFVSHIKQAIDLDMYIFAYIDSSKIEQYMKLNLDLHEIFIYGYNDEEKLIYFADFPINDTVKYERSICSYEEIEDAFTSIMDFAYPLTKPIGLIKYTNSSPYEFDLSYVRNSIKEYIYPNRNIAENYNNYAMSLFKFLDWKTKTYIGVDVYDFFINHINSALTKGYPLGVEMFHGLYDHKEMMLKRIDHFVEKGYMSADKLAISNEYVAIKDRALAIRNLVLKYRLQKKDSVLDKAKILLNETRPLEIQLLKNIFDIT